ncbi:hypothetical protein M404DRAFT_25763 [Pisolithus tinctorius Marx 270]|uniref:Uncharacterized protein n=1 Tax=Pisolithus tinctorius Marx 270 TaxID=870435 RepID=A0A0C3PB10_PISTI|nr:hypothetical protein M404DRAFT_25763 [Pisolithus tinctorius Marx 270]
MSNLRLIVTADNNNEGQVIVNWAQVPDDDIRCDTDNGEEVMREQTQLEAERVERAKAEAERAERERAEAEKAAQEAEEKRVHEEEERQEAECKCKGDEAGAGARGEVKRVVMDPSCTCCSWAKVVCKFLVYGNKKQVACMHCNQSKGKCWWPRDGKDAEASPKAASKVNKGKKRKADDETPEPRLSQKKQVKSKLTEVLEIDEPEASGSGARKAVTGEFSGLEDRLEWLIDITGLIANNLAGPFGLQEAAVGTLGQTIDVLKAIINESYSFGVAVTSSDLGLSELDSDELHEEVEWLWAEGKEEEAKGEDENMAEAE